MKSLLKKWKKSAAKKLINIICILDLPVLQIKVFNHTTHLVSVHVLLGEQRLRGYPCGSQLDVQGIARGIIWTPVLFKSVIYTYNRSSFHCHRSLYVNLIQLYNLLILVSISHTNQNNLRCLSTLFHPSSVL